MWRPTHVCACSIMLPDRNRIINVGLRFSTLGIRFLFIFFLARNLSAESVGYYGLFTATIGYFMYFVGIDFYIYATRELLRTPKNRRGELLKSQAALAGWLYVAIVPVAALFLAQTDWPLALVWLFLPILAFEYFNQEVYRLLVAFSEQISASLLLFIRQGSWAIAASGLMFFLPESRNLATVISLWAVAGLGAALMGIWRVRRLGLGGWRAPVNRKWIRKGAAISLAFLLATLALRGMQTLDRYWLQALVDIKTVGAYVLFLGMTGALMVFLDAAVFSYGYPTLIRHSHNQEEKKARALVWQMLWQTLGFSVLFAATSWMVLPFLLDWVGNPVYQASISLFPWVLAAAILNAIGMVPHYALYARGQDRTIILSHIAALPVFAVTTFATSQISSYFAVPTGLVAGFAVILLWKSLVYLKMTAAIVRQTPNL